MLAGAFVEVQHHDHAEVACLGAEEIRRRPWNRLRQVKRHLAGRPLRVEGLEGELGETGDARSRGRSALEGRQTALDIERSRLRGGLLDERDSHEALGARPVPETARARRF